MQSSPSANSLIGRAIGALFFAGFGAIWILLALYARQILSPANVALVAADLAVLLVGALWLFRRAKLFARLPEDRASTRAFNRINGIQWVAIAVVSFSLARLHLDAYIMCAITAIVGLHVFPLARLFRYRMHYFTGAALVVWAAASAIYSPADQMQSTAALGTGILLWVSSWITLILAMRAAQTTRPQRVIA